MSIHNAKITSTQLGWSERGLTFWLNLEWDGAGQGYGGHSLMQVKVKALATLLSVLGVDYWEKLPGTLVRIEDASRLTKIGHIIKDKWFNLDKDLLTN